MFSIEFADMSWEEFQAHRLGASQNCSATKGTHKLTDVVLPETVSITISISVFLLIIHLRRCWIFLPTSFSLIVCLFVVFVVCRKTGGRMALSALLKTKVIADLAGHSGKQVKVMEKG